MPRQQASLQPGACIDSPLLPRYAQEFSELLAEHIRDIFPYARRGAEKLALVR
jgi:hypothetical protein